MNKIPKAKKKIDWSNVISLAEDHVQQVFDREDGEGVSEDDDHYIFEAVLEAIYGHKIWDKYNKHM